MEIGVKVFANLSIIVSFLGLVANSLVILVLYKRRDLRTPWNLVTLPLNISEIVFSALNTSMCIIIQLNPFKSPSTCCTIQGFLTLFTSTFSVYSLIIIAVERYHAVCHSKALSLRWWIYMTIAALIYSILLALLPLINPIGFVMAPTGTYCIVPWYSTLWIHKLTGALALINLTMGSNIIGFCYLHIFQHYKKVSQSSTRAKVTFSSVAPQQAQMDEDPPAPQQKETEAQKQTKRDRIIMLKSALYVVTFSTLWFPYVVLIFWEMASNIPAVAIWHFTAIFFAESSSFINPLTFILLSPAFKQEMRNIFIPTKE